MSNLSLAAPAKINLYLHVTGRRDDGFHTLDSLVAFADIHDTVRLSAADDLSLTLDGPFASDLKDEADNLVLRAARALARISGTTQGAHLRLSKHLPLASGIGGGSADAAATLKGLMQLWDVQIPPVDLQALALDLGADVPICLHGRPAFMGGIGEDITAAPTLPASPLVLVNPGIHLSTPSVFQAGDWHRGEFSASGRFDQAPRDGAELAALLNGRSNDLAAAAKRLAPEIRDVLAALNTCEGNLIARMSGSGATCFALFATADQAANASRMLAKDHSRWWVRAGSLINDA